jgi:lactococcin 972 family bacteriocin
MNVLKKAALVIAIATPIIAAPTAAFAASETVGGGTWNWGNTVGHNYSDYLHSGVRHSSTVICGDNTERAVAAAGKWSNASLTAISGCGFYWNNAV